jgi:hypothetical protein
MSGRRASVVATFSALPAFSQGPSMVAVVIPHMVRSLAEVNQRSRVMADFNTYKNSFPHAKLSRSPEVLEVVLHTNGGSVIFNGYAHEEYVDLFH